MSFGTLALQVIALVFMFFARIRFPVNHSIVNVLWKRYGKNLVKNVRKFEKYDFKYKKMILDLDFLLACKEKNVITMFLRVKVANNYYDNSDTSHDAHKVIFNFSSHVHAKSLLRKGLNFVILPKDINYTDYILPFELLYRDINSLKISNFELDCLKARLRDSAFSSYKETSKFMENNLPKAEFHALQSLIRNKELIIQKVDKGNKVVLLNRKDYISKMKLILADSSKFKKIQIDDSKVLNHLIHKENKIDELLKKLKEKQEISNKVYKELCPAGFRPGLLYPLCKIHKSIVDGVPTF